MEFRILTLEQAANHVCVEAMTLKHVAQRGEIAAQKRGDDWYFDHRALDEWAQRNILASTDKEQKRLHQAMQLARLKAKKGEWRLSELFKLSGISLNLPGKTKAGVVRDMADLAIQTGLVYDPDGLYKELIAREEAASTAVGNGAAFLHPEFHDPYLFEAPFIAYGRASRPVFFGSLDGEPTRHFFMIGATDHELHLHILTRLAVMAHATEFLEILDNAMTAEDALAIISAAEEGVLRG